MTRLPNQILERRPRKHVARLITEEIGVVRIAADQCQARVEECETSLSALHKIGQVVYRRRWARGKRRVARLFFDRYTAHYLRLVQ